MYPGTCPPALILWIFPFYACLALPPHQLHQRERQHGEHLEGHSCSSIFIPTALAEIPCELRPPVCTSIRPLVLQVGKKRAVSCHWPEHFAPTLAPVTEVLSKRPTHNSSDSHIASTQDQSPKLVSRPWAGRHHKTHDATLTENIPGHSAPHRACTYGKQHAWMANGSKETRRPFHLLTTHLHSGSE